MGTDDTAPAGDSWDRAPPSLGARLGRYELKTVLGAGGMGVVFEATDPQLDRAVAVKILRPHGGRFDAAGAARLRREGMVMARLTHPNVIRVYDVGVEQDHVFVAMELVRGGTLAEWQDGRGADEIIRAYLHAGRGLAAAHDAGLVHRDFKPQNVLVGDDGRVLVTDFGLARPVDEDSIESLAALGSPGDLPRTILGTPAYMAPEQSLGGVVDARADQYSFCLALWRALAGPEADVSATASTAIVQPVINFDGAGASRVPARIREALRRGLEQAPDQRWPSIHEVLARLEPPRSKTPWIMAAGGVAIVAGVAVFVVVDRSPSEPPRAPAVVDPCAADDDRFGAIWNDDARGAVGAAFAATGVSYAATSFREVARQLDARARAWDASRKDSCVDTRVRGTQSDAMMDLRATCLDRRLADVAAFVVELRRADAAAVGGAAASAATIGDVTACNDVEALGRRAPMPPDAGARNAIAEIEQELSTARASVAAAHLEVGLTQAEAAVARARATRYPPLVAAALIVAGEAQVALERGEPARALYEEAALAAEAGGDDLLRFECEAALVRIYGYQLEKDEEALAHAHRAEALIQRLGPDPRRTALLARHWANADWWAGRYEVGRRRVQEAIDLYERIDPRGADIAKALHLRAILENEMRDDEATIATEARALPIAEAALGAEHPTVAAILQTGAGSMAKLEQFAAARVQYQRALTICEATFGVEAMRTAAVLLDLATVDMKEKRFADAVPVLRRGLAIFEKVSGPEHSRTALACERLGSALSQSGEPAEGEQLLRRAIAIHTKRLGADSPAAAASVKVLGKHFARIGQHAKARDTFAEAIRAFDKSQGPGSKLSIDPLLLLGDEELALGRRAPAEAAYRRALAAVAPDDEGNRAECLARLAALGKHP